MAQTSVQHTIQSLYKHDYKTSLPLETNVKLIQFNYSPLSLKFNWSNKVKPQQINQLESIWPLHDVKWIL